MHLPDARSIPPLESDCTEGTFDLPLVVNAVPYRSCLVWPLIVCGHLPCELSSAQSERTARGPLTSPCELKRTEYRTPFLFNLHSSLFCQLSRLLTTLQQGVKLPYRHIPTNQNNVHLHVLTVCQVWSNVSSEWTNHLFRSALVSVWVPKLHLCGLILRLQIQKL